MRARKKALPSVLEDIGFFLVLFAKTVLTQLL
jgi:hypothetical protein